jgi:hypothetical protein
MNTLFSRHLSGVIAAASLLWAGNAQATTRTVTNLADSGAGSLRQAIVDSANGDTINFSVTGTIALTSGPLNISKSLTITGPGARNLHVSGTNPSVFTTLTVFAGTSTISGLTIGPGRAGFTLGNAGTALTMNDCAISGNSVDGGIFTNASTTLHLNRCTVSDNHVSTEGMYGGGIINEGTATLTNCTISGNSYGVGAGMWNITGGTTTMVSCTVTGNTANTEGGGLRNTGNAADFKLTNTIVSGNTAGTGPDIWGDYQSNGYNLIAKKDAGTGFTNGVNHDIVGTTAAPRDALLVPLQNNGGPTDTCAMFASASPAYNAGNIALAPPRDQRSFLRPDTADIGACEFLGTQPVTLANISSRAVVQTGDDVLIGGFIITGNQLKNVLVRAIGPSLNLPGKLANPILELYQGGQLLITNDDWGNAANHVEIMNTGAAPTDALESAILSALSPGAYTVIVRGVNGGTGIGVVEAYDLNRAVGSRLANISTRAAVQAGDNVLIGGFIILGPDSLRVVVRAIGPSLSVPNYMADPFLELHDGNGATLAANDNWRVPNQAEISATGVAPTNDAESAIVMTLAPGSYTAVVRGVNNTTGVAIVEVYGLQ